jgi:hypothetical protein
MSFRNYAKEYYDTTSAAVDEIKENNHPSYNILVGVGVLSWMTIIFTASYVAVKTLMYIGNHK